MPYQTKTLNDIPNLFGCVYCNYNTKHSHFLLKHLKKCEYFDGDDDNIEYNVIGMDESEITIGEYVNQYNNLYNTMKTLIKTNELKAIENQPFEEIRTYIRNKLLTDIHIHYRRLEVDTLSIYTFFFGNSEDMINLMIEEAMKIGF